MISEHTFVFKDGSVKTIDCEYCRELETTNWHYYKTKDNVMVHLRKDAIAMIVGGSYEEVLNNRVVTYNDL